MHGTEWLSNDRKKTTTFLMANLRDFISFVERGVDTLKMVADHMHESFPNFLISRKCMIEQMLIKRHIVIFLPKFLPELNTIESLWALLSNLQKPCKYSLPSLVKNISLAYDSVTMWNTKTFS